MRGSLPRDPRAPRKKNRFELIRPIIKIPLTGSAPAFIAVDCHYRGTKTLSGEERERRKYSNLGPGPALGGSASLILQTINVRRGLYSGEARSAGSASERGKAVAADPTGSHVVRGGSNVRDRRRRTGQPTDLSEQSNFTTSFLDVRAPEGEAVRGMRDRQIFQIAFGKFLGGSTLLVKHGSN